MRRKEAGYLAMQQWMDSVGDPVFHPANEALLSGREMQKRNTTEYFDAGSCLGTPVKVAICAGDGYRAPPEKLLTGRILSVGDSEQFSRGLLRCFRDRDRVCVAYFERGELASMVLRVRTTTDGIDEGLFTWFGPSTYVGTPWSDNDPYRVSYATVDHLREFARARARKKKSA